MQRQAHGFEEAGGDQPEPGRRVSRPGRRLAGDLERSDPDTAAIAGGCRAHLRKRPDAREHLGVVMACRFRLAECLRRGHPHGQQVSRVESDVELRHVAERAHEQAGCDQENRGEGDLRDDQGNPQASASGALTGAAARFERVCQPVLPCCAPRRSEPAKDARDYWQPRPRTAARRDSRPWPADRRPTCRPAEGCSRVGGRAPTSRARLPGRRPGMPAARFSISSRRAMRHRLAPMAARMATSRMRAFTRAS